MRARRSKEWVDRVETEIYAACEEFHPRTVRQLFYHLVSTGLIEKTEMEYNRTVVRLVGDLRKAGALPWEWIVDETRVSRIPNTWDSTKEFGEDAARSFRLSPWKNHNIQVWCEKNTLSGFIHPITDKFAVRYNTVNGQSSMTFLHAQAMEIVRAGLPTFIYMLGDFDPSGEVSRNNIARRLTEWAPNAMLQFETLAVTEDQIKKYDLPLRPTKISGHSKKWNGGDSVELDALPPDVLRGLVKAAIFQWVDQCEWEALKEQEAHYRLAIKAALRQLGPAPRHHNGMKMLKTKLSLGK